MKYSFSEEQLAFRNGLRRFMEDVSPSTEVRRLMESEEGYDKSVWVRLANELGITGIHIPEAYGGQGFGVSELGIVLEEAGRALICAPIFSSTVLAATAVMKAGTEEQKQRLLPGLAAGKVRAALAWVEPGHSWLPEDCKCIAREVADVTTIHGSKSLVVDGHEADAFVVLARTPDCEADAGLSLFWVEGNADGIERRLQQSLDPTRKLANLHFDGVFAERLGSLNAGFRALNETLDVAAVCLAHEMAGGAERLLESAVDYANLRYQFGRPIGSFQSLKHKAADMVVDVELAKSAAYYSAASLDAGDGDASIAASAAKVQASESYMRTAAHTVQIHGGIGFTWDNDTHLWYKRAKSSEVFLGSPAFHRAKLMDRWEENQWADWGIQDD